MLGCCASGRRCGVDGGFVASAMCSDKRFCILAVGTTKAPGSLVRWEHDGASLQPYFKLESFHSAFESGVGINGIDVRGKG